MCVLCRITKEIRRLIIGHGLGWLSKEGNSKQWCKGQVGIVEEEEINEVENGRGEQRRRFSKEKLTINTFEQRPYGNL